MKHLRSIVLAVYALCVQSAVAQDKFMPGYYLTASGDSTRGFIRARLHYGSEITFRRSLKSESETLSVGVVTTFEFDGWSKYERITLNPGQPGEKAVFARVLVDGSIDLWRPENGYVLHDDSKGTFILAGSSSSNEEEARQNYQKNAGTFNILFQECEDVKEAASKAKIDEKSLRGLLANYHACKGTTARTYGNRRRVRSIGVYAGAAISNISFKGDPRYLSEPEFAPFTSPALGLIIVKQPNLFSPMAFQTELGFSSYEASASHYEIYSGGGNEFERDSNIAIKFVSVIARFGVRLTARSNYFNPYVASGLALGLAADRGSVVTGTFRINGQVTPVSEPVPLPSGTGAWVAVGGRKQFAGRMSIAADFHLSYASSMLMATPRIIALF